MASGLKQRLSGKQAKLEVNLDELLGFVVPNNSSLRQAIGQAIIDKIRDRTADNIGADGKRFKNYSKTYAESIEFLAYGKSKGDPNLKQSGDMLGFMDIIDESKNKIVIGWDDSDESAKAHGHITGNVGVKRDFLGLTDKEVKELRSEWREVLESATSDTSGPSIVDSVGSALKFTQGKDLPKQLIGFNQALQEFLGGGEE